MDLKSVPFFNRLMSASEKDRPTGNMDEAGNMEYVTRTGQTYFVKPSADQRTTRTKVEEDVLPAIKEYAQDPSLPSAEQMKQFGVDVVEGTYESIKGAVEGTGTMGDVFGVAPAMAVASSVAEVPEGAIRLFGGKSATSPGTTRSGAPAPESIGADSQYRFEIDDSQSVVVPTNYSQVAFNPDTPPTDISGFTSLADGLIHDDLFYQYPELKDMKVVFNDALPSDVLGSFYTDKDLVVLNKSFLDPSQTQNLRRTLLHEIQHAIQEKEGFTQGTNPRSTEVGQVTYQRINSPENASAWKDYEDEIKAHKQPENLREPVALARNFLEAYAKEAGYRLSEPNFFQRVVDKVKARDLNPILAQYLVKASKELDNIERNLEGLDPKYFDYYTGRLDTLYTNLAGLGETDAPELFKKITHLDAEELLNWKKSSSSNSFVHIFSPPPLQPELPPPGTNPVQNAVLQSTYERKRGEVEARNVGERMDYDLEARFQVTPEETEDFPRSEQWESPQKYNQGGLVPMDKQMSFFQRGGLLDDGQNVDPISGNEVPPGSLAEEVRDDVDAKLSEGEYVVPADVVRYYGVAYFEKLRNKAKAGLEDMEENGRIGGEPAMDSMEDELPFSDEELMFEEDGTPLEMAQGGFIAGNPGGFAPGSLGVTGSGGLGGGGTEVKTFINAAGEQRSFIFINGKPIQQIPAGFVEATEENRLKFAQDQTPEAIPTGEVTVPGTGGVDSPGMGEGTDTSGGSSSGRGFNVDDPLGAAQAALEGKGSGIVGGLVGGLLGSVVGAPQAGFQIGKGLGGLSSLSNAAANAEVASILGYDTTSIDKAITDAAKSNAAKNAVQNSRGKTNQDFYNAMLGVDAPIAFDRSSFQTDAAYSAAKDSLATAAEKADGLAPGSAVAMGQGLGDSSAGFEADFGEAQVHAQANPTGVTTGSPLGLDQAFGPGGPDSGIGTAPGNYSGPNLDGSAGFTVGDSGGGGGGGDGGTVICTALYNLGLLDKEVYALDAEYGQRNFTLDPAIIVGYHSWAKPIASHIQKDTFTAKLLLSIVAPLGQAWAKEMAHQMQPEKYKTNFLGKMLMKIGYPICKGIGNLKQGQVHAT